MEDTGRERGWRLMEQRLPSVPSRQSDLLITRGSGLFISGVMQIGGGDTLAYSHSQRKATFDIMGRLVFPLGDVELCDSLRVCLNEHFKGATTDSIAHAHTHTHIIRQHQPSNRSMTYLSIFAR